MHSLVPIAAVYVAAHYLTFLVFEGQAITYLASDPFGQGWDLFGTVDAGIDYTVFPQEDTWYVQVAVVVVGHVAALALAHDRALMLYRDTAARRPLAVLDARRDGRLHPPRPLVAGASRQLASRWWRRRVGARPPPQAIHSASAGRAVVEVGRDEAGRELVVLADRVLEGDGHARVRRTTATSRSCRARQPASGSTMPRVLLGRRADAGLGDPDRVRLRAAARGERRRRRRRPGPARRRRRAGCRRSTRTRRPAGRPAMNSGDAGDELASTSGCPRSRRSRAAGRRARRSSVCEQRAGELRVDAGREARRRRRRTRRAAG